MLLLHFPALYAREVVAPIAPALQDEIVRRLDTALTRRYPPDQPGAAIIVVRNGHTIFRKAYGLADVSKQLPMTPDMSLRLGSVTKQFTAAAILLLAEQGKLTLSDDIRKFLPEFPVEKGRITVEHLLTHTSGIVSYTAMRGFRARSAIEMSAADMIAHFKDEPKLFEAGTHYAYSNSNYFLLGAIIEQVSGLAYDDFVAQNIFIPLGMNDTAVEGHERSARRHVQGYEQSGQGFVPSRVISMSQAYAAGAMVSTVDDLKRWEAVIAGTRLLAEASWEKAFTPFTLSDGRVTKYGYGWEIGKLSGLKIISHGGYVDGFNAGVLRIPELKLYVAVLSNTGGRGDAESVAVQAASIVMAQTPD